MIITKAVWKYDLDTNKWYLIDPNNKFRGTIAEVAPNGAWQTFDTDGAGGESGSESRIEFAKESAEESAYSLGYL